MRHQAYVNRATAITFCGALPNLYLVPIPGGQKARVGDRLLTYWQSGSGTQRAGATNGS